MRYVFGVFWVAVTVALCWFFDAKRIDALPIGLGRMLDPLGGIWHNAERQKPDGEIELELEGPNEIIRVIYDDRRVPHVFAYNDEDLYFAQGYVTARDRLWQMEFQVKAAAGRLSELIDNPRVRDLDRLERRMGMRVAAERSLASMEADDKIKMCLDAYTAGVNAYIDNLGWEDYPFEYKLLNYEPEPWTNLKIMFLLKRIARDLSSRSLDFENSNSLTALGWDRYQEVFPAMTDSASPIIPRSHQWEFDSVTVPRTPQDSISLTTIGKLFYPQPHENNGSNNWAVHPTKTKEGYAILCNDPHLGLSLPSIWYEIQLHGPFINSYGVTLPGAPGVIIGFNEDIAWGITNSSRDVLDWYQIEFKDASREEYKYGNGWRPVERVVEEIKLTDGSILYDTVLWTHHGPVVYDQNFQDPGSERPINVAMRWAAHDPGREFLTFYYLNRGKDHDDYRTALQYYDSPGQNFVFASRDGNIAITQQGRFPNKWEGQGQFVMDGSNPEHDWQGYIPVLHNPHVLNPPRGFVSSANQNPVDESYPYRTDGYYDQTRSRRINQALTKMHNVTVDDMKQLQNDVTNLLAEETIGDMLRLLDQSRLDAAEMEMVKELKKWNRQNAPHEIGAAYWEMWSLAVRNHAWEGYQQDDDYKRHMPSHYMTLHNVAAPASDTLATDSMRTRSSDILHAALKDAVARAEQWRADNPDLELTWYTYNGVIVRHLARLPELSHDMMEVGGNAGIVNATRGNHGASWRMVVQMGPEVKAWGIYPGGPSGNPGSYWYDNQLEQWSTGQYEELRFYKSMEDAEKTTLSVLTMNKKD